MEADRAPKSGCGDFDSFHVRPEVRRYQAHELEPTGAVEAEIGLAELDGGLNRRACIFC